MDTARDGNSYIDHPEFNVWSLRGAHGASIASERHPERNEDSFLVDKTNNVFGVFDGVGGYIGGEVASGIAAQVASHWADTPILGEGLGAVTSHLKQTLLEANSGILSVTPEAATTAVLVKLHQADGISYASIAHVGDSRAYILHDGVLRTLTTDHTPYREPGHTQQAMARQERLADVATQTDMRALSVQSMIAFKSRSIIGAFLGQDDEVKVDVKHFVVAPGDTIILTSDGVHDNLTTEEMQSLLNATTVDSDRAQALTEAANRRAKASHLRAKMDDITAVVVNI